MKKHLISFATDNYKNSQDNLNISGIKYGFDTSFGYQPKHIDHYFINNNNDVFQNGDIRGYGYWIWKPFILLDYMNKIEYGDIVMYSDVGLSFISDVTPLFNLLVDNKDMLFFKVHNCTTNMFIKRDCFFYMGCDDKMYYDTELTNGAFQIFKKTKKTLSFLENYSFLCKDYRLISDSTNECGLNNFKEFIDHRHDQSILSLLRIKNSIEIYRDPSQYGNEFITENSCYGQIINHHRIKY